MTIKSGGSGKKRAGRHDPPRTAAQPRCRQRAVDRLLPPPRPGYRVRHRCSFAATNILGRGVPMFHRSLRLVVIVAVAIEATVLVINAAGPANFKPDGMFTGSTLAGWHVVGDADWKAQNGELVGTAKPGGNGGWLVMDKSFQDVQLYASYRCTGACTSGVLLRAQKTPEGGMSGVYVSLTDGDSASYAVTIDAVGKKRTRERGAAPAGPGRRRGGGARRWGRP